MFTSWICPNEATCKAAKNSPNHRSLLAASARVMQMNETASYNETIYEPEPTLAEKLFELNDQGQFQLVWPKNPAITFTDADDAAVMEWWSAKNAEATALDQEFINAYKHYESAVSQPYNDFLT